MSTRLVFAIVAFFALSCRGAEQNTLPRTFSPDKRVVIVEERDEETGRDYYFARASDHRRLGSVLPPEQQGQVSNVAIVASWNARGSRVALLVFYGTRLSELLLFTRDAAGQFQVVSWQSPDAEAIYQQRTGHHLPRPGVGLSSNAVGPWEDENTVHLIAGESVQTEDQNRYTDLLASFRATVHGRRASVSAVRLHGPLTQEAADRFQRRWGRRFFDSSGD